MKLSTFIIILIVLISSEITAQSKVFISANTVIGYNDESIDIWKYKFENSYSVGYEIGIGYQYYYKEKYFVKTGIHLRQMFSNFEVNNVQGKGTSYTGIIPLELGLKLYDDFEISTGVSFQNYKDLSDFDINSSYNIRYNLIVSGSYWINKKWKTELSFSRLISSNYSSLIVKTYTSHFKFGINYYLF